ncbi:MAG TPA: M28 family metallopeptidase [Candidatus Acidoferrales bacterium]|nr:M28 family metallopeptidase [Candidatus Acidoferrales bacterium]
MRISARLSTLILICVICATCCQCTSDYPSKEMLDRITTQGIRANMSYLADDLLEGRGTGTRGYQLAAIYIRARFEELGLEAAGENGTYFQNIPFRQLKPVPEKDSLVIKRPDGSIKFAFEKDYLMAGDPLHQEASVEAPIVFAGYGVTAPEAHYDDYAGLDAKGKIVVLVLGAPPTFPSADRAFYSDDLVKARNAASHGAIGIIGIWAGEQTKNTPWKEIIRFFHQPVMNWLDDKGVPNDYVPEIKAGAFMNDQSAAALFKGSGHTFDEAMTSITAAKPLSFPLVGTATLHEAATYAESTSPNIAAVLRGSDPHLKDEYVVFSAHADHVGIGDPVNGDAIYNGAVDNASGTSALLEIARAFAGEHDRPKRSILFVAVTGEEAGLLGSDYFAKHPTVPISQIVADINMDGVSLFYDFKDIVALGADHSSLDDQVRDVARRMGLEVSPDPMPEENFFIRSDQYSFVKQGVPSLAITEGFKTVDPSLDGRKIAIQWETTRYHTPQDDMSQPLDFNAARKCTRVILAVGYEVAQAPQRPTWNSGDMFGQRFGRH